MTDLFHWGVPHTLSQPNTHQQQQQSQPATVQDPFRSADSQSLSGSAGFPDLSIVSKFSYTCLKNFSFSRKIIVHSIG